MHLGHWERGINRKIDHAAPLPRICFCPPTHKNVTSTSILTATVWFRGCIRNLLFSRTASTPHA